LAPALQATRVDLTSVLNEETPRTGSNGRLRAALVTAQVAVSLVLLVGAGLVMRGLDAAARTNAGFDDRNVMSIMVDLQPHAYTERRGRTFYRSLLDSLRGDPIVQLATLASVDPLAFLDLPAEPLAVDGYQPRPGEDLAVLSNTIGSDYFRTLRIELLAGRPFEERDTETTMPVAIVNRTFAERLLGNPDAALGKRIRLAGGAWRSIIGVAADVKYVRLNESPRPFVYVPFTQSYHPGMIVYARSVTGKATIVGDLRGHVSALDPDLTGDPVRPLSDVRRIALLAYQVTAVMLFVFGAAGMIVAVMGTYGLVSYSVQQHTREIGIRMALGATAMSVIRMLLGRGLRLGGVGIAIGLAVAFTVAELLGGVLFGVSLTDVTSFVRALAIVSGGVVVATFVPAWRAARTNPLVALRHQ
jgi:predicted permease